MTDAEIVRRVAEEVMGWHIENRHLEKPRANDAWYKGTIFKFWVTTENDKEGFFDPLTNANHWMMVVEKMRELGYCCTIDLPLPGLAVSVWFWKYNEYGSKRALDANLGHALCLAALAAISQ